MNGTVNPARYVSEEERSALVTVEVAERLMVKAYRLLEGEPSEADRLEAQMLLIEAIDLTTARTCTAVKQQVFSDEISKVARAEVAKVVARVDQTMAPLREVKPGVWRHTDDGSACHSY